MASSSSQHPASQSVSLFDIYQHANADQAKFVSLASLNADAKTRLNIFGVIVSFGSPKRTGTNASHAWSLSFSIIDPSTPKPNQCVCLNWFFNELSDAPTSVRIGDMLICQDVRIGIYKDHPQIRGNQNHSRITLFHCHRSYADLDHSALPASFQFRGPLLIATRLAYSKSPGYANCVVNSPGALLSKDDWTMYSLGKPKPYSWGEITPLLAWMVLTMSGWARETLSSHSLGAPTGDAPLLPLHAIVHGGHQNRSQRYGDCAPGSPIPAASPCCGSCVDTVAMVVRQLLPPLDQMDQHPAILLLWDGTANGVCPVRLEDVNDITRSLAAASHEGVAPTDSSQTSLLLPADTPVLLGGAVMVQATDVCMNGLLAQCVPGTWLRLRNVMTMFVTKPPPVISAAALESPSMEVALQAHRDSQLGIVDAYFRDVRSITARYLERLAAVRALPPPAPAPASRSTPAGPHAAISSAPHEDASAPARNVAKLRVSAAGYPFTPLAKVLSLPSPGQFCCFGKVVSWFPRHASRFAIESKQLRSAPSSPAALVAVQSTQTTANDDQAVYDDIIVTQMDEEDADDQLPFCGTQTDGADTFDMNDSLLMTQVDEPATTQQDLDYYRHLAQATTSSHSRIMFALRLTDGTAHADVIFYHHDAEHFLGVSAEELRSNEPLQEQVQQMLENKRGHEIEFYVKAYTLPKKRKRGKAKFAVKRLRGFQSQLNPPQHANSDF